MTRETKIGLIVGMGVIIFIGILVSDHLAQTQPNNQTKLRLRQIEGDTFIADGQAPLPQHESVPVFDPRQSEHTATETPRHERHRELPHARTIDREHQPIREEAGRRAEPIIERQERTEPPIGRVSDILEMRPREQQAIVGRNGDRIHHVQQGESLYQIAQKYYGDGNYWHTIKEANRQGDKVGEDGSVRAGVRLVIPNRSGGGDGGTPQVAPQRTPTRQTPTVETASADSRYTEYTIQPGDVLSLLAQRFYGTARKTNALYELNRDRIDDPDSLVVGMKIRVPAQ